MSTPLSSALGGTLCRLPEGYRWRDGTVETRVRDMKLSDVAPNFRCTSHGGTSFVEIPNGWRQQRYWPRGVVDEEAASRIAELVRDAGHPAAIYAEGLAEILDDHRLSKSGTLVDAAQWDALMCEHCGVWWDMEHQEEILTRARSLGWRSGCST